MKPNPITCLICFVAGVFLGFFCQDQPVKITRNGNQEVRIQECRGPLTIQETWSNLEYRAHRENDELTREEYYEAGKPNVIVVENPETYRMERVQVIPIPIPIPIDDIKVIK